MNEGILKLNVKMRSDEPFVAKVQMTDPLEEPLCRGPGVNIKWNLGRIAFGD